MAYLQPWDEGTPVGSTELGEDLDTIIQNLKISMRERLEDVIPDWSDDLVQPKTIFKSQAGVTRVATTSLTWQAPPTILTWDTEVFDKNDMIDLGVADDTINIPESGIYLLVASINVGLDGGDTADHWSPSLSIIKNFASLVGRGSQSIPSPSFGDIIVTVIAELTAGDTVQCQVVWITVDRNPMFFSQGRFQAARIA